MPRLRRGVGGGAVVEEKKLEGSSKIGVASSLTTAAVSGSRTRANRSRISPVSTVLGKKKGVAVSENDKRVGRPGGAGGVKRPSPKAPLPPVDAKKPRTKFPDRLQWKMKNLKMPTTSTPKRDPKLPEYDINNAFGFDDSSETIADYSTLLSPIPAASPKGIIPPVWKVHPLSQRNTDIVPPSAPPTTAGRPRPATGAGPSSSSTKQLPLPSSYHHLKCGIASGTEGQQERRSPRLQKVIKVPILQRPTSTVTSLPSTSTGDIQVKAKPPASKVIEKTILLDDTLEAPPHKKTVPSARSSSTSQLPQKSKAPILTTQKTIKTERVAPPPPVTATVTPATPPKPISKGRRRPKKKLLAPLTPVPPKESPLQRPTRVTRSKKTTAASTTASSFSTSTASTPTPPPRITKKPVKKSRRAPPPVKAPPTSLSKNASLVIEEFEADEESVIEVFLPVKKTTSKSKSVKPNVKTSVPKTTKRPVVGGGDKTKAPLHLIERRPQLLETKPLQEGRRNGGSPFSQLLHRLHDEEEPAKDPDGELHVDPKKIMRTYASRRKRVIYSEDRDPETEYDFTPKPTADDSSVMLINNDMDQPEDNHQVPKRTKKKKTLKKKEDEDEELNKWLAEKNREFEEVSKTPLVVELSFSD